MVDSDQVWKSVSLVLGWLYMFSWSASFYPQPILNLRRGTTEGLALDFFALNVLGFISYTVSTSCFLFSPEIRSQYAYRHPRSPTPTVRFNDFAFAVHALVAVSLTLSQFVPGLWGLEIPPKQKTSLLGRTIIIGSLLAVFFTSILVVFSRDIGRWQWIDVIYVFGHIKLIATFVKYAPQVYKNWQRKDTEGWSIYQILFDAFGGVASLSQLVIDASFQQDWSGITGNPAKFGLSLVSMTFDVVFIVQHYILYAGSRDKYDDLSSSRDADTPLLQET